MKQKINIIYFLIITLLVPIYSNEDNTDLKEYFELYNQIFEIFTSNYVDSLDKTELIKSSFNSTN